VRSSSGFARGVVLGVRGSPYNACSFAGFFVGLHQQQSHVLDPARITSASIPAGSSSSGRQQLQQLVSDLQDQGLSEALPLAYDPEAINRCAFRGYVRGVVGF
jgi:hypothetical protein